MLLLPRRRCLLKTAKVSILFSKIFPSNPECKADNHISLSIGVGAEHLTCVPEYVTSRKSADLDGDDIAADSEDNDVVVVLLLGVPFGVKKPDFLVDTGGGFHADAPTILISDCACVYNEDKQ